MEVFIDKSTTQQKVLIPDVHSRTVFLPNPTNVTACYWWTILDTDVHTFLADQQIRLHV